MLQSKLQPKTAEDPSAQLRPAAEDRRGGDRDSSVECPTCGAQNPRGFVFCRNCGQLLPQLP